MIYFLAVKINDIISCVKGLAKSGMRCGNHYPNLFVDGVGFAKGIKLNNNGRVRKPFYQYYSDRVEVILLAAIQSLLHGYVYLGIKPFFIYLVGIDTPITLKYNDAG
jgi:hypothetical protein